MAATYVTVAELRLNLGIQSLYSDTLLEEVCQSAENIVTSYLWKNQKYNIAHSNTTTTATLYFSEIITNFFYVGQSVVITGNGSQLNGNKTLTAVSDNKISYALNGSPTAHSYHPVNPYGIVSADSYVDYSTVPEVREASMLIATDIWQSRQASNAGGISPDFSPSPYRMGNTLIARVRGLLQNHLSPNGLVG
jgi:hypothetical protein